MRNLTSATNHREEPKKLLEKDFKKKDFGSKDTITSDCNGNYKEPLCEDLFPPKGRLGVKLPIRGDIRLDIGGVKKVLDVVISHPRAHAEPRVVDTPGFAAHFAALKKENLYYNNFVIPAGHMVPLSAETGGRFDGAFSIFLKEVVTSGLDFGESPRPVWTKEKRALFASLRM